MFKRTLFFIYLLYSWNAILLLCRIAADRLTQICPPDRLRCQPADDNFESEKHAIYRYIHVCLRSIKLGANAPSYKGRSGRFFSRSRGELLSFRIWIIFAFLELGKAFLEPECSTEEVLPTVFTRPPSKICAQFLKPGVTHKSRVTRGLRKKLHFRNLLPQAKLGVTFQKLTRHHQWGNPDITLGQVKCLLTLTTIMTIR